MSDDVLKAIKAMFDASDKPLPASPFACLGRAGKMALVCGILRESAEMVRKMDDLPVEAEQATDAFYLKKYKELLECVREHFDASDAVETKLVTGSSIEDTIFALGLLRGIEYRLHWLIGRPIPPSPSFAIGERFKLIHGEKTAIIIGLGDDDAAHVVIDSGTENVGSMIWLSYAYLSLCTRIPTGSVDDARLAVPVAHGRRGR